MDEAVSGDKAVEVRSVTLRYPTEKGHTLTALESFGLDVGRGEFVAVLGPSGCGKSSLLRVVAALEAPTEGYVTIDGEPPEEAVSAHRLGVAFQDDALMPWLGVEANIALPFKAARLSTDKDRIAELVQLVGLQGFERTRPRALSGGMRQRVSIARALALEPDLLLLDEPFGSLDAVTRRRLNVELQRIWTRSAVTTLLVTHDVNEAVFLADRVVVMTDRPGRVRLIRDIPFDRPRSAETARSTKFHEIVDDLTEALVEEQSVEALELRDEAAPTTNSRPGASPVATQREEP